jgi:hypothetical protein
MKGIAFLFCFLPFFSEFEGTGPLGSEVTTMVLNRMDLDIYERGEGPVDPEHIQMSKTGISASRRRSEGVWEVINQKGRENARRGADPRCSAAQTEPGPPPSHLLSHPLHLPGRRKRKKEKKCLIVSNR